MDHRILAVALGALILAIALMVAVSPDTGPPVTPAPRPVARVVPAVELPRPVPAARQLRHEVAEDDEEDPFVTMAPPVRRPSALPPIDPDQVFPAELRGIASAAVARRSRFEACWEEYRSRAERDFEGRLTVRITVSTVEDRGEASTEVANGPADDGFDACIADVMADARFESPGGQNFTMMWPVPIRAE